MTTMKILKSIVLLIGAVAVSAIFSACEDNIESKNLYVYMQWHQPYMKASVSYTSSGELSGGCEELKIRLTRESPADVWVRVELVPELIESWNSEHKTEYPTITSDIISMDEEILIPAGKLESTSKLQISLEKLDKMTTYLLPVRISSLRSDDKGVSISSNLNTIYLMLAMSEVNNIDRTEGKPSGIRIERSGWNVTVSDVSTNNHSSDKMLDGDPATCWRGKGNKSSIVTIDMGQPIAVKAFEFLTVSDEKYYATNPKTVSISVSEDGNIWRSYGESQRLLNTTGSNAPGETNYVKFINVTPMRYWRIQITSHWSTFGSGFAELNALQ